MPPKQEASFFRAALPSTRPAARLSRKFQTQRHPAIWLWNTCMATEAMTPEIMHGEYALETLLSFCFVRTFAHLNFLAAGPMRTPLFITLGPLQLFTTLPATDSNTTPHTAMTSQLWLSASNLAWPPQGSAERSLAFKSGASTHASPYLLLHLRPFSVASLPSVGVVLDLALSLWVVTTIARRSYFLSRAAPALLRCTRRTYRDLPAKTPLKTSSSSRL